jgi:hypothetical protein
MDPSTEGAYNWLPIRSLEDRWHDEDDGVRRYGIGIVISDKPI